MNDTDLPVHVDRFTPKLPDAPPLPTRGGHFPRLDDDEVLTLNCSSLGLGPPLPPRVPLKRSLSLTNRPPPPPVLKIMSTNRPGTTDVPPTAGGCMPLIVDPLRARSQGNALVRSAPTLNNLNSSHHVLLFSSRGQIKFVPLTSNNYETSDSNAHVVSLARWPLPESQPRSNLLTIDTLAGKFSPSSNEYVESPGTVGKLRCHGSKCLTSMSSNSQGNIHHLTSLSPHPYIASVAVSNEKKSYSMLQKLRKFVRSKNKSTSGSSSDDNSPTSLLPTQSTSNQKSLECVNSIICRKCGKCRCRDCLKKSSRKYSNLPNKDAAVDCLTCMCLVKPVFYHCLKDNSGEEDCSEKPCACCSQPNCMSRWTMMNFLLPCLPCLCFYLPLKYAVSNCYDCCDDNTSCRCSNSMPTNSGCKTLLESENSSI